MKTRDAHEKARFPFLRLHRPQQLHNTELGGVSGIKEVTLDIHEISTHGLNTLTLK